MPVVQTRRIAPKPYSHATRKPAMATLAGQGQVAGGQGVADPGKHVADPAGQVRKLGFEPIHHRADRPAGPREVSDQPDHGGGYQPDRR